MQTSPTPSECRDILRTEFRKALANIKPNNYGVVATEDLPYAKPTYSGQQIAAAKGIARKRALAIIDRKREAQRAANEVSAQIEQDNARMWEEAGELT